MYESNEGGGSLELSMASRGHDDSPVIERTPTQPIIDVSAQDEARANYQLALRASSEADVDVRIAECAVEAARREYEETCKAYERVCSEIAPKGDTAPFTPADGRRVRTLQIAMDRRTEAARALEQASSPLQSALATAKMKLAGATEARAVLDASARVEGSENAPASEQKHPN